MRVIVDIDETVCATPETRDYTKSVALADRIQKINKLYDEGNTIIYWTARGSGTGLDWREITENQLKKWGAHYHELQLYKPMYDLFICDKAINSEVYFSNKEEEVS